MDKLLGRIANGTYTNQDWYDYVEWCQDKSHLFVRAELARVRQQLR